MQPRSLIEATSHNSPENLGNSLWRTINVSTKAYLSLSKGTELVLSVEKSLQILNVKKSIKQSASVSMSSGKI